MTQREQPSGTVTLVFTDVEGSTTLLHDLGPDAYRQALAEHRRVVRETFDAAGGYEVDAEGDAFFYAFSSPQPAVDAAAAATAKLDSGPMRIRVGIHTGQPKLDPPGYVGLDVHKAARIMSAGHGGQILLSSATRELVNSETIDLGEHRLKDFDRPVRLHQLGVRAFPPLKTIGASNLPTAVSSFLGREHELAQAAALVESARLLTITGPGGTGKTRFAIELARRHGDAFPDGQYWVPLAPLRDASLVLPAIAQSVGAHGDVAAHIGAKRMLVLLDNLEHVIDAGATLPALLEECSNLCILVTSRELLGVQGEREFALPPLSETDGVELFVERSGVASSAAVEELCIRLDNLPLAIELAAARSRVLTPEQLLDRLGHRLDLLKGGRDRDERQQTLRATVEWSYNLLDEDERELFARIAVFVGGCTLEAIEAVCDGELDTLQSLVEKSLVRGAAGRYWQLETIRELASELLAASGEEEMLCGRHAAWFVERCEAVWAGSARPGHDRLVEDLARDEHNAVAAMAWALDHDLALALRFGESLWEFWLIRGRLAQGALLLEQLIARTESRTSRARAWALFGLGTLARGLDGDPMLRAYDLHLRALAAFQEIGDASGEAGAYMDAGTDLLFGGDRQGAETHYREARVMASSCGDRRLLGYILNCYALLLVDDPSRRVEARALGDEALVHLDAIGDNWGVACVAGTLGTLCLAEQDDAGAMHLFRRELEEGRQFTSLAPIVEGLLGIACISTRAGYPAEAASLFGQVDRLEREIGLQNLTVLDCSNERAAVEDALGPDRYHLLAAQGAAMELDAAIEFAISTAAAMG